MLATLVQTIFRGGAGWLSRHAINRSMVSFVLVALALVVLLPGFLIHCFCTETVDPIDD